MILLTTRYYGSEEEPENLTEGVFSSLEKAKEMALANVGGVISKEDDARGYFRISCGGGTAFDYEYDWTEIELDKII